MKKQLAIGITLALFAHSQTASAATGVVLTATESNSSSTFSVGDTLVETLNLTAHNTNGSYQDLLGTLTINWNWQGAESSTQTYDLSAITLNPAGAVNDTYSWTESHSFTLTEAGSFASSDATGNINYTLNLYDPTANLSVTSFADQDYVVTANTSVPEPTSIALLTAGFLGFSATRRKAVQA